MMHVYIFRLSLSHQKISYPWLRYDAQGIELTSHIYLPPCMHALHNFPYEVSTEMAFAVHYIIQGLLMKTVGGLTCKELKVFSMREKT